MAPRAPKPLTLSEDQVHYFRARRGFLVGQGAQDAAEVAHRLAGVQAQVLGAALLALSQRLESRTAAADLKVQLLETRPRQLVRTWGQRDTLHLYDAEKDWLQVVCAGEEWSTSGRRGGMPPAPLLGKARERLREWSGPVGRSDLFDLLPKSYLEEIQELGLERREAQRFGAGRLIWKLASEGRLSLGPKRGSEQLYDQRGELFPELDWRPRPSVREAAVGLTERYLRCYGPSTVQDVAHFFGARVTAARAWVEELREADQLLSVACEERQNLWALRSDRRFLAVEVPRGVRQWPLRLVPGYDSLLMAHADKSWTVPATEERKAVWKKAAIVSPVVLVRGRVVATWAHQVKGRQLTVTVVPLSAWRERSHLASVRREAQVIARHFACAEERVAVDVR